MKMSEVDEAAVGAAENDSSTEEHGTVSDSQAAGTDAQNEGGEENKPDVAALQQQLADEKAAREALAKEKQNAELERNNLRNKIREAERQKLENIDKENVEELKTAYQELLEREQAREAQEKADAELKEARTLRDTEIAKRPEAVQKAARALLDKNESAFAWFNARDEADALSQVNSQLDALQSSIVVDSAAQKEQGVENANNPAPGAPGNPQFKTLDEEVEWMKKNLPHSDRAY